MIYLDTSAAVKLVRNEAESAELAGWLDNHRPTPWVSSTLIEVELTRALRRTENTLLAAVPGLIAQLNRYEIDDVVRAAAAAHPDPMLRSLDAIHLATASVAFGAMLTAFVSYDERQVAAATAAGLPVATPGRATRG